MEVADTPASRSEENDGMNKQYMLNYSINIKVCVDVNTFLSVIPRFVAIKSVSNDHLSSTCKHIQSCTLAGTAFK